MKTNYDLINNLVRIKTEFVVPPEISEEKINITGNLGETVVLPCNASGIPEPVISWMKVPDIDIIGKEEKYQVMGSALAIKNLSIEDDGFYHCIAKSEAGQSIATRKVSVQRKLFTFFSKKRRFRNIKNPTRIEGNFKNKIKK